MARLFQKPKLESKDYLDKLQKQVLDITKQVEELQTVYFDKHAVLEGEFQRTRAEKVKELDALENQMSILRKDREHLERPFEDKRKELAEWEAKVAKDATEVIVREQKAFEAQRAAERKLEDVQNLADELGETRVRLVVRENLIKGKENVLKGKENDILLRIELTQKEANRVAGLLTERESAVLLRELNVDSKEENLVKREKELLNGHILLTDQRGTLARAWEELGRKKLVSTKRLKG